MKTLNNHAEVSDERFVKEYEEFVYIVSHDLKAPLRHVKQFTRLLIEGRAETPNPEEREYIAYLEKSLEKLDKMQEALLIFSRLNTHAGPFQAVDCKNLADKILSGHKNAGKENWDVRCGDLPVINAEPKQLHMAFSHLIDNAFKFHGDDAKGEISVSAAENGDYWRFEIRDNGIGILGSSQAQAFRLFCQLEPGKYPGIGAGLPIAKKIIQRHGGEIEISSDSGEGTAVRFWLPKEISG